MSVTRERVDVLGNSYPFEVVEERLQLKAGMDPLENAYVALLGITVSHAYGLSDDPAPHDVFEDVVEQALKARLEYAVNFGRVKKRSGQLRRGRRAGMPNGFAKGQSSCRLADEAGSRRERRRDSSL